MISRLIHSKYSDELKEIHLNLSVNQVGEVKNYYKKSILLYLLTHKKINCKIR